MPVVVVVVRRTAVEVIAVDRALRGERRLNHHANDCGDDDTSDTEPDLLRRFRRSFLEAFSEQ